MSIEIKINLPDVAADGHSGVSLAAMRAHMEALGYERINVRVFEKGAAVDAGPFASAASSAAGTTSAPVTEAADQSGSAASASPSNTRERGKPAPGRARRTKEEIAEDEAADKADASTTTTTQGISTGESRVGPEDDAETEAQDRADEAAEEGKTVEAEPQKTLQELIMEGKGYIGAYAQKFGMEGAQQDGPAIFNAALGLPKGDGWRWSTLADAGDYAGTVKAVAAWKAAAAAKERFGA